MGGSKNKSPAQKEKEQTAKESKGKSKKKEKEDSGPKKADIVVTLDDAQASKFIKNAKVITAHELAKQTGVKVSAANAYLRRSLESGTVKKVGGFSGHHIYQPVSS